jgi:ParB family chromosome partitioning protein
VLVDGYRRVRALAALGRDLVLALDLACSEDEALVRAWRLGVGRRPEAIEEAWLLRALLTEHGLDLRTLATRTGRTVSWVSRRLGLVEALPASVQQILQRGAVCAHAAQKVLVPLARANASHCERVAAVFAEERWSSRQIAQWWRAWRAADGAARERLVPRPRSTCARWPPSVAAWRCRRRPPRAARPRRWARLRRPAGEPGRSWRGCSATTPR